MLKIGDFSKLSCISIRMLRYYDEHNMLKPTFIDANTNYRFYNVKQLVMANKVNKKSFTYILDGFQSLPKLDIITELIENATYNNTKLIATIHNQEEINDIYGKNIFSKVANTINMSKLDNIKIDDTVNTAIYPNLNDEEIKLFDVNKLI